MLNTLSINMVEEEQECEVLGYVELLYEVLDKLEKELHKETDDIYDIDYSAVHKMIDKVFGKVRE